MSVAAMVGMWGSRTFGNNPDQAMHLVEHRGQAERDRGAEIAAAALGGIVHRIDSIMPQRTTV